MGIRIRELDDWDPKQKMIGLVVKIRGYEYIFHLYKKNYHYRLTWLSLREQGAPIMVRQTTSWERLAKIMYIDRNDINEKNAKKKVEAIMNKHDVIVDLDNGWYYYLDRKRMRRGDIETYYLCDRFKFGDRRDEFYDNEQNYRL